MKKIYLLYLGVCILALCALVVEAVPEGNLEVILDPSNDGGFTGESSSASPISGSRWPTGQTPDPSNNGGLTGEPGHFGQQPPSDNDAGFTREIVYQQEFTTNQPTYGNSGGNSWGTPGEGYLTQKPSDYGKLTETGTAPGFGQQSPSGGQPGPNGLWIVDSTGLNRYPEMSIPLNGYAREEITPSVEGQITIEEMYPDGKLRTYGMGYVKPFSVYKMWFYGDIPGTHMIRYNVNGYYSNTIRFYVQGQGTGSSAPSPGTKAVAISRKGNSITRTSSSSIGFSSTGHTAMSSSGGSMSISTSFG